MDRTQYKDNTRFEVLKKDIFLLKLLVTFYKTKNIINLLNKHLFLSTPTLFMQFLVIYWLYTKKTRKIYKNLVNRQI